MSLLVERLRGWLEDIDALDDSNVGTRGKVAVAVTVLLLAVILGLNAPSLIK